MTTEKVNINFRLPEFSVTKIVTRKCNVDQSSKSRYSMITGRYLLMDSGMGMHFYRNIIEGGMEKYEVFTELIIGISSYHFKPLKKSHPFFK